MKYTQEKKRNKQLTHNSHSNLKCVMLSSVSGQDALTWITFTFSPEITKKLGKVYMIFFIQDTGHQVSGGQCSLRQETNGVSLGESV